MSCTGFIRDREMSGKFKIFQGQGIVREFHNLSGKIEFLLKCQGILEFQMKFRFSNKIFLKDYILDGEMSL